MIDANIQDFLTAYDAAPESIQDALAFVFKLTAAMTCAGAQTTPSRMTPAPRPVRVDAAPRGVSAQRRAKFRAKLARDLWEVSLKSELIDRAVDMWASGEVTGREIAAAVRRAENDRAAYDRTGRGVDAKWKSFAASLKGWYARAGLTWTPCAGGTEPYPPPAPPIEARAIL